MSSVTITTFGYLHQDPPPAHITLDLRAHFKDPHVKPALRYMTAHDAAVREAVLSTSGIKDLITATAAAVAAFTAGPTTGPIAVAVGCAGGRHRAAVVGMELAVRLTTCLPVPVHVVHRDLDKELVDR